MASRTEPGEVAADNDESPGASDKQSDLAADIQARNLEHLEELKKRIDELTEIPKPLLDVSLKCLQPSTMEYLSYHLDKELDIMTDDDCLKDYRGLAERIGLEPLFIKYIAGAKYAMLKTSEVLSKWLTRTEPPAPTLGNLQTILREIERLDVLEDMSVKMAQDAFQWKMIELEACTKNPRKKKEDTSWQLTRHDVVSGKKTMYTAGLVYADEDELMAQLIIKLYKKAYNDALFFNPNFDLKTGKYVLNTTAQVISERCDHKVVFLLSEYFYASEICQFAVNYAASQGTGNGNLIPFHLTRNVDAIPNVLRGIAGIRWFRKTTRRHTWTVLTDSLLAEKLAADTLHGVKDKITKLVERDGDYYLQDPPYDEDIEPPGEPYPVIEPEGSSSMPPMDSMDIQLERGMKQNASKTERWKLLKRIRKAIVEKVLKVPSPKQKPSPSWEMMSINSNTKKTSSSHVHSKDNIKLNGCTETDKAADSCKGKCIYKRKADEAIPLDKTQDGDKDKTEEDERVTS